MDDDGNLRFRDEFTINYEAWNIAVSADGRVVAFGSIFIPTLCFVFIGEDGTIAAPIYRNNPDPDYSMYIDHNPVVFHRSVPLVYAGFFPISSFRYSLQQQTVESTDYVTEESYRIWNQNLGYSLYCNSLVYARTMSRPNEPISGVQTLRVNANGSFGDVGTSCTIATYLVRDMVTSPNGRWAAVTTQEHPKLYLVRIEEDGAPILTQSLDFPTSETANPLNLSFTPNGRFVLLLSLYGAYRLSLFELDEAQGTLTRRSWIDEYGPGWKILSPRAVAVSPDGRYVAFRAQNPKNLAHDLISIVRIHEDGALEYLHGKEMEVPYLQYTMAFAPLPETAAQDWTLYE
jgi:hypothetical protein